MQSQSANHFDLVSVWDFDAQPELVWRFISDGQHWSEWWPSVETVEKIDAGTPGGEHSVWHYTWRTMLPYKVRLVLRIIRIEPPRLLEADVSGDVIGRGICRVTRREGGTRVFFQWDVRTCKKWMKWLAPLARPIFEWNHSMVMRQGRVRLAMLLTQQRDRTAISVR